MIISYSVPDKCPVCGHELLVNRLSCTYCATKIEGEFSTSKFCRLPAEQREFIEVFIKCGAVLRGGEGVGHFLSHGEEPLRFCDCRPGLLGC